MTKAPPSAPATATNDNAGSPQYQRPPKVSPKDAVIMGLRFYSRLPTGQSEHLPLNFGKMVQFLPVTSFLIGIFPAFAILIMGLAGIQSLFVALCAIILSAILTGAMAEDAFADAMDGLFGGYTPAKRLEIMRDSRHGTYGVLGIVAPFMIRVVTLGTLVAVSPIAAALLWLATTMIARQAAPILTVLLPAARADGASAGAGKLSQKDFLAGLVPAMMIFSIFAILLAGPIGFGVAVLISAAICFGWHKLLVRLVGGQTGDTIGALQLLLEIAALSAFILV